MFLFGLSVGISLTMGYFFYREIRKMDDTSNIEKASNPKAHYIGKKPK